jgi:hypothetical protein
MAKNDDKKTVVEEKTVSGGGMPYGPGFSGEFVWNQNLLL